jgi:hypothetical protein
MNKTKMLCPLFILFGMVVSTPSAVESNTKEAGTQTDPYPIQQDPKYTIQQALNIISHVQKVVNKNHALVPNKWERTEEENFISSFESYINRLSVEQISKKADLLLQKGNLEQDIMTLIRGIKAKVEERFSYILRGFANYANFKFDNDSNISGMPTEDTSEFFGTLITSKLKENTDEDVQSFVKELEKLGRREQDLANVIVEDFKDNYADRLNKKNKQAEILK